MSHGEHQHRGGYRRGGRGGRRDDRDRRPPAVESPGEKLRAQVVKLGEGKEFDPSEELPTLASRLREGLLQNSTEHPQAISEGLRIGVTEQPYKIPYYAVLLTLLVTPVPAPDETTGGDDATVPSAPVGQAVLESFNKGFQEFVDSLAWRELRLCVQFFAHLSLSHTISTSSMLALLQSFTLVLREPGVSYSRAEKAALCAGDGLLRAGQLLYEHDSAAVLEIITEISTFARSYSSTKPLVSPIQLVNTDSLSPNNGVTELLDNLVACLSSPDDPTFMQPPACLPSPHQDFAAPTHPFELPSILIPPELDSLDEGGLEASDKRGRRSEMPSVALRTFEDDITPDPTTKEGFYLRSTITDVIDIFEVNRKEGARILLELPRWTRNGTYKGKPGIGGDPAVDEGWVLESTVLETVLAQMFRLPQSTHKPVYYFVLIADLCRASPQTVGPAVGKSFRKVYSLLGHGLDIEVSRRFAEWFASHMSNFGFNWVWKEWLPDLSLTQDHPRRVFIKRAVDLEIRLAYYDRILKTLPEEMQVPEADAIADQAPGPEFEYDDPGHPYYEYAQSLLTLIRGRSSATEVMQHMETLRSQLHDTHMDANADLIMHGVTVQILLHVGSRSFSHFLNAVERYLSILRDAVKTVEDRAEILDSAGKFWRRNPQMIGIVFDKLMQYQIVDPADVVRWVFRCGERNGTGKKFIRYTEWDILCAALEKAHGRIVQTRRKAATMRKEEEEAKGKAKAADGDTMEVDTEMKQDDSTSNALATVLSAVNALSKEQLNALKSTMDGFISMLLTSPTPTSVSVIQSDSWENRNIWGPSEWGLWETWGWYANFCREFAPQLKTCVVTLEATCLTAIPSSGTEKEDVELFKKIWSVALGQDS